jgi:hypothetical protein
MYNPNRVSLSKDTQNPKTDKTHSQTHKNEQTQSAFSFKRSTKTLRTQTPSQTHTHQNAQTQLEFACLQKSTKTLSIHTNTFTKCTNPNKVFLQNVQQSKIEFDNLQN